MRTQAVIVCSFRKILGTRVASFYAFQPLQPHDVCCRLSIKLGRYRERLCCVHHEHDQRGQIGRPAVEDLHLHAGAVSIHYLARFDMSDSVRSFLT